ncbi:MAG: FAD binding domain-containing protein [Candidatus Eisenbacteria bacterium]|uniref:FAD binding domain-containing protein n=1 Tax=Eiseniibacteriota bacterium TaxID=2212470 RepID=A0A9D6L9A1_UNCEI|nr:FAD binding domain-containing protein [Candidatus Eisenbacteria bacterium]MBI3540199.1 FAD binding domain-containing protein [Candidatus Eisenbacteria bacterium]
MLTLPRFEWVEPRTLDQLLDHLAAHAAESLMVAGGTDAVPNLKHRLHEPRYLVHIGRVEELRFVRDEADGLHVGPLVTLADLARHPVVRRDFATLTRAASLVAGPQLRNMGTIGGNLCLDTRCTYYNQTFFWREALGFCLKKDGAVCHVVPQGKRCVAAHSSDTAPVLITLDAEVEIRSRAARRTVPVESFFVADGIHNNVLAPGEVVTRVFVPARARARIGGYQKLRPRGAIDFPMLSVAFAASRRDGHVADARLVVSALAAKPRSVTGLDALLADGVLDDAAIERIAQAAAKQCRPVINIPYDEDYRHAMVPVFVRRALREALGLPPRAAREVVTA